MIMNKAISFAAATLVCLSMSGCKELPMESYTTLTAEPQTVIVGENLTLSVPLPTEKAKGIASAITESPSPLITAVYNAPDLEISGIAAGTAEVQIEFSAGWLYKKSSITIPVVCELPQLEATVTAEALGFVGGNDNPSSPIKLEIGSDVVLAVASPEEGIAVAAQTTATGFLEATIDGLNIKLHPLKPGSTTMDISLRKEGFRDLLMSCPVEIVAIPTPLALSEGTDAAIKITKGHAFPVPLEYEGELAAVSDSNNVHATIKDGQLVLTAVAEGAATVTVTTKKENYLDNSLVLTCTVTAAAPPPAPVVDTPTGEYASLISEIVKYTNTERANVGLPALKLNNTLSAAAAIRAKETAVPGYQGHTRPDGRRGLTAIADAGLGDYGGENLSGSSESENGAEIVQRWMDSPPHRAAMLEKEFKSIGVGAYYDGDIYRYCQLFIQ